MLIIIYTPKHCETIQFANKLWVYLIINIFILEQISLELSISLDDIIVYIIWVKLIL